MSALCSGLLTIGPRFGGALDKAAEMFTEVCYWGGATLLEGPLVAAYFLCGSLHETQLGNGAGVDLKTMRFALLHRGQTRVLTPRSM